jgi:hypothetical protein
MFSYGIEINRLRYGFRWRSLVIAAACCFASPHRIAADGVDPTFFATQSLSRASLFENKDRGRISQGRTPPSEAGKRKATREVPANELPGRRTFKGEMFKFDAFRAFGITNAGAATAPGVTLPRRQ